ncbi:hypothetical protein [Ramlibacter humi]|uniref:DUF2783 domain-containing protein n=1 Tax=Ramlibacter humi TaxID=2530451 RepID=A0A4Z0BHK4_9BURK|nr:hypothetical protein [Ramlibacter humi]TFY98211.1 hypothetical protein EZ216_16565 [Ramlibacter humi]
MNDQDLDIAYTAICHALGEVGPENAQRFLAMLCLALMARSDSAGDVLPLIESVRARSVD